MIALTSSILAIQSLGSLKILNLSYSVELLETPDFRGLPSLEKLILIGCVGLVKISGTIIILERLVWLDLQACLSLRNIPVLPTSLVTLKLSGLTYLGAIGNGKWWNSLPLHLVSLNISNCNLSCDSFPRDFSRLVSLESLNMSGNPFQALPHCVQNLPHLLILNMAGCWLQSLPGLPSTLQKVDLSDNHSLVEVSSVPDSIVHWRYIGSRILAVVEGCFKSVLVDNADRNIISHLSLESISFVKSDLESISSQEIWGGDGSGYPVSRADPIKLWYEFGIFSVCVPGEELPGCYMFKEMGSQIFFKVPSLPNNPKISGFNVSFVCRSEITLPYHWTSLKVSVYNKTKDLLWVYIPTLTSLRIYRKVGDKVCFLWLSLWKCGEFLEAGDEAHVSIGIHLSAIGEALKYKECDECSVNLVYEDMILEKNDMEEDTWKELVQHKMTCQLSWTDKMLVEISDYVHTGKRYCFSSFVTPQGGYGNNGDEEFFDWLGPQCRSSDRYFDGGLRRCIKLTDPPLLAATPEE